MQERSGFVSAILGNMLAKNKARKDTDRNRNRLEQAALASRDLKTQRIADIEIKKLIARLAYEAEGYIQAALASDGAFYEPQALDALDSAKAAINTWKMRENESAVNKYLVVTANDLVIPKETSTGYPNTEPKALNAEAREQTLRIVRESLRIFVIQNSIRQAGDPDAALAELAEYYLPPRSEELG